MLSTPQRTLLYCSLLSLPLLASSALAEPQGFHNHAGEPRGFSEKAQRGNTIHGILTKAKADDYVVLEGYFIEALDESKKSYLFSDQQGDTIAVFLPQSTELAPYSDRLFYIWGRVARSFGQTHLNVLAYSLR